MRNVLVVHYWSRSGSRWGWAYRRLSNGTWMCEVSKRFVSRSLVLAELRGSMEWERK